MKRKLWDEYTEWVESKADFLRADLDGVRVMRLSNEFVNMVCRKSDAIEDQTMLVTMLCASNLVVLDSGPLDYSVR